jgi:hypothetical protein
MKKKGLDLLKQKFHPHQLRRIWSKAIDEVERQPLSLCNLRDQMTSFVSEDEDEEFDFVSTTIAPLDPEPQAQFTSDG